MKLLGAPPPSKPLTQEGALITTLPRKQLTVEKVTDGDGSGPWWEGRIIFISNSEAVIIPVRCKALTIVGAGGRAVRIAKKALPKKVRKGNKLRLRKILVELVEYAKG